MTELVIVGDEAYLPEEWEKIERRRAYDRQRKARDYAADPEHFRAYMREYRARRRGYFREYKREWKDRHSVTVPVASLHDLRCTGPTKATGCRCHKVVFQVAA